MKKIFQVILVGLFIISSNQAFAQIKLDVKTKFSDKYELTVIKHGILKSISSTDWLTEVEVGEDYSLYIKNLHKEAENDSIAIYVDIELREPSMFNEGDLIAYGELRTPYRSNMVQDNMSIKLLADFFQTEQGQNLKAIKVASSLMNVVPGSNFFLQGINKGVISELQREPTPAQLLEGTLVGSQVIIELDKFFND